MYVSLKGAARPPTPAAAAQLGAAGAAVARARFTAQLYIFARRGSTRPGSGHDTRLSISNVLYITINKC